MMSCFGPCPGCREPGGWLRRGYLLYCLLCGYEEPPRFTGMGVARWPANVLRFGKGVTS